MKLTIEGFSGKNMTNQPCEAVRKVVEVLHKLPNGKLVTSARLCELSKISLGHLRSNHLHWPVAMYRVKRGNSVFWANAKTIEEFRKQT